MTKITPELLEQIRARFAQVDHCPQQGPRIFFENAGGALTLNSVVGTSQAYAAVPDNQGRDNPGSHELVRVINKGQRRYGRVHERPGGQFFVGESGTELLFSFDHERLSGHRHRSGTWHNAGHPATRSACARWAGVAGQDHVLVVHDDATGTVTADAYAAQVMPDTKVATIVHTSPVTGMGVDVAAVAAEIRTVAPNCFIIIDGIQHAAHGRIDLTAL